MSAGILNQDSIILYVDISQVIHGKYFFEVKIQRQKMVTILSNKKIFLDLLLGQLSTQ